jgi:hypothetical protein
MAALGGGGWWAWRNGIFAPEKPAVEPAPVPAPAPEPTPARTLFPQADKQVVFDLDDGTRSTELLLSDGDRVVQTYNGVVYVTWLLAPEGVLRADPKGSGFLLRYLPLKLEDGLVWKQQAKGETVWFRLSRPGRCPESVATQAAAGGGAECWQVQVLNRRELTTFTFAAGMGPVGAVAQNALTPRESFTKVLRSFGTAPVLDAAQRKALLEKGLKPGGMTLAPVEPSTAIEFESAVKTQTSTSALTRP